MVLTVLVAQEVHGQVELVAHRDVVEVRRAAAAERDLGQRRRSRGVPRELAAQGARAVAGHAPPVVADEVAAGAPPDPAGLWSPRAP